MKNKILIDLIIVILFINVFSIAIIYAAESTGTTSSTSLTETTSTTGTVNSQATATKETTTHIAGEQTQNIGKQVLKNGKPEDVQVTGGKFQYQENEGGKFTATGKSIDGKTDLSDKTDFKSKDNEVARAKDGSIAEIDNKGHITALDVTGKKPDKPGEETKVKISGRTKDTEIQVSEGSKLKTNQQLTEKEKTPVYEVQLKEGSQLEKPKITKKEKKEEEQNDPNFRFNGINIGLSDPMAEQLGLPKNTRFTGTLAIDSNGNWFTDKGSKGITFLGADRKTPVVRAPDIASKYGNINERTYFFNKNDWNSEQGKLFRDIGGGSAVIIDAKSKYISSLSTNGKLGAYIELGEGNPFNGYRSAIMPDKISEVSIQGKDVKFKGDGIFYAGEGIGFRKQGNELFFQKGAKIENIFGPAISQEFGLKFDSSKTYSADVYSLDKNGNPISDQRRNLLVRSKISDNNAITNQVMPLDTKGVPIAQPEEPRITQNEAPKDTKGKGIASGLLDRIKGLKEALPGLINTPVEPVQPPQQPQIPKSVIDLLKNIKPSAQQIPVTLSNGQSVPLFGSEGNFQKALVIIASQPGCGPCVALARQLNGNLPQGVQVVTVDITQNPGIAQRLGIQGRGTPTAVQVDPNTGKGMRMVSGSDSAYNFIRSLR